MGKGDDGSRQWAEEACHKLKHDTGAVADLLEQMREKLKAGVRAKATRDTLEKAVTYFTNNGDKMAYKTYRSMGFSIGSGVTEAACKCVAKARMCGAGMRWDTKGAAEVLALRTMVKTDGRWESSGIR